MPQAYFEALYAAKADPWDFATSPYEAAKYVRTIEALGHRRYRHGFEIGCSIGMLTRALATRCDSLLANDVSHHALEQAKRNCAGLTNVRFVQSQIPQQWPSGMFDLTIFSEVLYYLSFEDITRAAARTKASLTPHGHVLLVHWLGETNYPCTGDDASAHFIEALGLPCHFTVRETEYRLDLLG